MDSNGYFSQSSEMPGQCGCQSSFAHLHNFDYYYKAVDLKQEEKHACNTWRDCEQSSSVF